jgi:hypothetical protein
VTRTQIFYALINARRLLTTKQPEPTVPRRGSGGTCWPGPAMDTPRPVAVFAALIYSSDESVSDRCTDTYICAKAFAPVRLTQRQKVSAIVLTQRLVAKQRDREYAVVTGNPPYSIPPYPDRQPGSSRTR